MKVCSKCGNQMGENAKFCNKCGGDSENIAKTASTISNVNATVIQQNKFVDPSENQVAKIGNNFMQNAILRGTLERDTLILTEKRLYYEGKNFYQNGKVKKCTTNCIVDINDISFTGYSFYSSVFGIASLFALALSISSFFFSGLVLGALSILLFGMSIILIIIHYILCVNVFQVCFVGGRFEFDVKRCSKTEIDDFQRQLHLMKDKKKYGN